MEYRFFSTEDMESMETLRAAYRLQALEIHPDKHNESEADHWTAEFKVLQAEYEDILSRRSREQWEEDRSSYGLEKSLQDMIDKALRIPKIHIELCGCWLWISGDTYMSRMRLKVAGFKYSKKKERWYWGMTMVSGKKKKKSRHKDMKSIYKAYGREVIGESEAEEPLLIGI